MQPGGDDNLLQIDFPIAEISDCFHEAQKT